MGWEFDRDNATALDSIPIPTQREHDLARRMVLREAPDCLEVLGLDS